MAILRTDLEALMYLLLIGVSLYLVNLLLTYFIDKIKKILPENKNKIKFVMRLLSLVLFLYFLIEGFPSFTTIPPEYTVLITGAISTAIAFATSEIFSNFISGILIWLVDPFDMGDVVNIMGHKGIIRSTTLTKIKIETFDRIIVEISNSDILSSTILNYTIKLKRRKNFYRFKRKIQTPQDIGHARLDIDKYDDEMRKKEENEIREFFDLVLERDKSEIHSFTFSMRVPYEKFRIKVDKIEKLCKTYKEVFDFPPKFHLFNFSNEISVKFRILTLDSEKLLNHQADFANKLYKIILQNKL
jgi:small-conductance mechanosensitive channel